MVFAQAHLVGQHHAFAEWVVQRKQRGVDLVRVEVDAGVEQRLRKSVVFRRGSAARQLPGEVLGVVRVMP